MRHQDPYDLPVPLVRELSADLETPISAYLKVAGLGPSFLLESVTGGERLARYSFIGVDPKKLLVVYPDRMDVIDAASGHTESVPIEEGDDPFELIRKESHKCRIAEIPGLPRFAGGLVGYLGYEMVRYVEPVLGLKPHGELPDAILMHADTLIAFDHAFGRMLLIAVPRASGSQGKEEAEARLDTLEKKLSSPLSYSVTGRKMMDVEREKKPEELKPLVSNQTEEEFKANVIKAKEHIAKGDIFQLVYSQRLSRKTTAKPFQIYRKLRRINPSPYMYYFDFAYMIGGEPLRIIGASPELHVRLEDGKAVVRPIAGTMPRGKTEEEDLAIEKKLLADEKERAEHIMLVDLGRNDLGRVCSYGSVEVTERFVIERYSHVMHIVSQVEGHIPPDSDFEAIDLLKATFPAGTVSGAPKIRAMQIIDKLERDPRGIYAGVIGYLASDGSMDTCITIRTMVMRGDEISVQAGAGIVADSDPAMEYRESMNKAKALAVAVDLAEAEGDR